MQLECQQCQKQLNLPDDKLPVGKHFSFVCPYCKHKNSGYLAPPGEETPGAMTHLPPPIEAEAAAEENEPRGRADDQPAPFRRPPSPRPDSIAPPPPAPVPGGFGGEEEEAAMLPGGITDERPKALIVYDDEETTNTLIEKLETIGYQSTVAINVRDAAKQIKFTKFEVLLLQEDYYGSNLAGNQLLRAVQALDTHRRRGMLVVLISPTMVTLDDLLAFCLSIDAVVNIEDLHTIDRILLSTVGRAKKFYDAYQEMLASCGLE